MMWAKILIRQSTDGEYSDMHDWLCIHNTKEEGTAVIDPHLIDATGEISTLTFSVYAGSETATLLSPENRDKCEVWVCEYINYDTDPDDLGYTLRHYHPDGEDENGKVWRLDVFVGHAVEFTPYYADNGLLTYQIMCVDNRDYLNKSIQQRRHYSLAADITKVYGGGIKDGVSEFIDYHNDIVTGAFMSRDQFNVQFDVENQRNNYDYIVDWEVTQNALQERFIDRFGGELIVDNNSYATDRGDDPPIYSPYTYIRWVDEWGRNSDCVIQNGINLKSLRITTDATEVCTRLIPLGTMGEDGSKLTIANVETQAPYPANNPIVDAKPINQYYVDIYNSQYISNHGITCKTVEFDDITLEANLFEKAVEWLAENNRIRKTYEAEVLDLAANGGFDPLYRLRCGDYHAVRHSGMGVNETLRIVKIDYDLANLHRVSVTFGDKFYNDIQRDLAKDAAQTARVDKVVYNNSTTARTLDENQKAMTSEQEWEQQQQTWSAESTLSGKEISMQMYTKSGGQKAPMGKIGFEAETYGGLVGYSGSAQYPSFILKPYGQFTTEDVIVLSGDASDLIMTIQGLQVSLRDYIAHHM